MAVANRLDPFGQTWTPWANGVLMYAIGRYAEAIEWFGRLTNADNLARPLLAAALSKEGDLDQARIVLEKFLQTAKEDMASLPGNHEEDWIDYLRVYMTFDGERDFEDSYDALLKAAWRELLCAMPDLPKDEA